MEGEREAKWGAWPLRRPREVKRRKKRGGRRWRRHPEKERNNLIGMGRTKESKGTIQFQSSVVIYDDDDDVVC